MTSLKARVTIILLATWLAAAGQKARVITPGNGLTGTTSVSKDTLPPISILFADSNDRGFIRADSIWNTDTVQIVALVSDSTGIVQVMKIFCIEENAGKFVKRGSGSVWLWQPLPVYLGPDRKPLRKDQTVWMTRGIN